jgi:Zn-dependent protease with chaperone function
LPLLRLTLALCFVPGMFAILIGGALVMLALAICTAIGGYFMLTSFFSHTYFSFNVLKAELAMILVVLGLLLTLLQGSWLMLRAIRESFAKSCHFEPAIRLAMLPNTPISDFIKEICTGMGAHMPDHVLLHACPEIYVSQSRVVALNGKASGRILMLSAPLLGVLRRDELRAVIAHEMAHFTGRDTGFSSLVVPVYRGTEAALMAIGELLTASEGVHFGRKFFLLPIVWCLRLYRAAFHMVNMSLSRCRELRADYVGAQFAGRESFQRALLRLACFASLFYDKFPEYLQGNRQPGSELRNLYSEFISYARQSSGELAGFAREYLAEAEDTDSSHPSLPRRLDGIKALPPGETDPRPARDLVPRIDVLEKQLTEAMRPILNRMVISGVPRDRRVRLDDLQPVG